MPADKELADADPPPRGLIFTLSEQIRMYGPIDVVRALMFVLDAKLAQPGLADDLADAIRKATDTIRPALHQAWFEWPFKE